MHGSPAICFSSCPPCATSSAAPVGHAQNCGAWDAAQSVRPQSLVALLETLVLCVQHPALCICGMLCTEANGVELGHEQLRRPAVAPAWSPSGCFCLSCCKMRSRGAIQSRAAAWPGSATCVYVQHPASAGLVVFSLHGPWHQVCSSMQRVCREGCPHARQAHNMAATKHSEGINYGLCLCSPYDMASTPGHSAQPCIWVQAGDPPAGRGWLPVPAAAAWSLPGLTGHHAACSA